MNYFQEEDDMVFVDVSKADREQFREMHAWLEEHVGKQDIDWAYHYNHKRSWSHWYKMSGQDAIVFRLRFGI